MRNFVFVIIVLTVPCAGQNILSNPGFEPPAEDGLAHGWRNNTWGDCETEYALDRQKPHGGQTCQKIKCVRRKTGASQFLQPLQVKAGKRYVIKLWVRAEGNVPFVGAALRRSPPPYHKHVKDTFQPGPNWELFEFEGVSLEAEDNAGLYIWFEADGSGTVWVDDASVEVTEPKTTGGPPPEGNVVANSSFEVNPKRTWDNTGVGAHWPCEEHVAHGNRCLQFDLPAGGKFRLQTPCMEFSGADEEFTLACTARATGGPVNLRISLESAVRTGRKSTLLTLNAKPDEQLRRFSNSDAVPNTLNGAYYLRVSGSAQDAGELWLDAISLKRGGPEYEPSSQLQAALSTRKFNNIFTPGDEKTMHLEVFNSGPEFDGTPVIRVRDYAELLVSQMQVPLEIDPGKLATTGLPLNMDRRGAFRADVHIDRDAPPAASMVFTVVPTPKNVPPDESVVGGHFATNSDWQMQIARRLGYNWTRIHDCSSITHWRTAEPQKGEWQFFDEQVDRVRGAGLQILGEFLRVPNWATVAEQDTPAYNRGVGPYRNADDFENYVRTIVDHYSPDISHWEIWNEPYHKGFYGGSASEYGKMALLAGRTAKEAAPDCTLLAPCGHPTQVDWMQKAIGAGALKYADIFSYHGYGSLSSEPYQQINKLATRQEMVMPRWNTETGVTAASFYRHLPAKLENSYTRWLGPAPVKRAVHNCLKLFVLTIASGSDKFFYYWTNVEKGMCPRLASMSIYEYDRTIRPHGVVYAIAASLLDPCEGAGIVDYDAGITCCRLRTNDEFAAVLWAKYRAADGRYEIDLPESVRAVDLMGNVISTRQACRISQAPVYLFVPADDAPQLQAALDEAFAKEGQ